MNDLLAFVLSGLFLIYVIVVLVIKIKMFIPTIRGIIFGTPKESRDVLIHYLLRTWFWIFYIKKDSK